jgi:hypothetical protein
MGAVVMLTAVKTGKKRGIFNPIGKFRGLADGP